LRWRVWRKVSTREELARTERAAWRRASGSGNSGLVPRRSLRLYTNHSVVRTTHSLCICAYISTSLYIYICTYIYTCIPTYIHIYICAEPAPAATPVSSLDAACACTPTGSQCRDRATRTYSIYTSIPTYIHIYISIFPYLSLYLLN